MSEHADVGTADSESLVSGYSGRVFLAIAVGWLGLRLGRGVIAPLLPTVIDRLAITPFLAGVALTTMTVLKALCQFFGGRLADALTRKTVLMGALGAIGGGLLVLSFAVTYPLFVAGVTVVGIGAGLFFSPMRAGLADLFVERRGRAFGVNESVGSAGSVVASGVVVAVLAVGTWRIAFLPGFVFVVLGAVVLHRWHREPYVVSEVDLQIWETVARLVGNRNVRWLLVAYSLEMFALQGVFNFLPAYLQAAKSFSTALASGSYGLLFVVGMIVMPLAGTVSDGRDRTVIAVGSLLVSVVGLVSVLLASTPWIVIAAVAVFAGGILGFPPVIQAHLMAVFPDGSMARDFGGFKTVYLAVGSLSPSYVGYVADVAGYAPAFWGLVGCLLGSVLLIALARVGD